MKTLSIGEAKINFIEYNSDKERTLFFIHGNSHSLKTFSHQYNSKIFNDYRLVFVDLPGHGESSKIVNYSIKNFAAIIVKMIEALELKNIILVGHSLGGHVAINILKYYRPKGVVLFGTPPLKNPFDPSAFLANTNASALNLERAKKSEIEALMLEMNYKNESMKLGVEDYLRTDPVFRTAIFGDIINGIHENEKNLINSFPGHVMFLLASADSLVNNNYIRNEFQSTSELVMVDLFAGHSPHIEASEDFNKIILELARKVNEENLETNITNNSPQPESIYEQRN